MYIYNICIRVKCTKCIKAKSFISQEEMLNNEILRISELFEMKVYSEYLLMRYYSLV